MVKRDDLVQFIYKALGKELIEKAQKIDPNGNDVQILGKENVTKVAVGVSLNEKFLEKAISWGAEFCIFHHGLDTRTYQSLLPTYLQKRLSIIFQKNLTICGFHYALDVHETLGNNALIIKKLGYLLL